MPQGFSSLRRPAWGPSGPPGGGQGYRPASASLRLGSPTIAPHPRSTNGLAALRPRSTCACAPLTSVAAGPGLSDLRGLAVPPRWPAGAAYQATKRRSTRSCQRSPTIVGNLQHERPQQARASPTRPGEWGTLLFSGVSLDRLASVVRPARHWSLTSESPGPLRAHPTPWGPRTALLRHPPSALHPLTGEIRPTSAQSASGSAGSTASTDQTPRGPHEPVRGHRSGRPTRAGAPAWTPA